MDHTMQNSQVAQIAARMREMREILEITAETMSAGLGLTPVEYARYENGEIDIPIGIIYGAAAVMGIDSTTLLTGEGARMTDYTVVRNGCGLSVERYPGYSFTSLATNFIDRDMDPMIVTIGAEDKPAKLVSHKGQEFNYVLSGTIIITIGAKEITLHAGDSIYFNPLIPHGQRADGVESTFLTVINEGGQGKKGN